MPIIEVAHVTKEYRLGQLQSLRQGLFNLVAKARGQEVVRNAPFKALDDVSFSIDPGEVVGIIGHNGAGKSTLLKLLSRITVPTHGNVRVQGRVAPLIEVGAGLIGELTGRENIFLNATILGMSKAEIRRKFDEIVSFAELEQFIDTPLKRYSSGMMIRLGFSIATSVSSEILLVDEVLAVGDMAFQRKCFDRMDQMINKGDRTILIVGHNIRQMERMCTRVVLLDHGRVTMDGEPDVVCNSFIEAMQARVNAEHLARFNRTSAEFTTGQVDLAQIGVRGASPAEAEAAVPLSVRLSLEVREPVPDAEIVVGLHTPDLIYVTENSSLSSRSRPTLQPGSTEIECSFGDNLLRPGIYGVGVGIYDQQGRCIWRGDNLVPFEVPAASTTGRGAVTRGLIDLPCAWTIEHVRDAQATRTEAPTH